MYGSGFSGLWGLTLKHRVVNWSAWHAQEVIQDPQLTSVAARSLDPVYAQLRVSSGRLS